jgi:hypothetical protein
MGCLEIIHLRLAGATPPGLVADIRQAIRQAIGVGGTVTQAHIYRHAKVAGDLSIHLHLGPGEGSRLSALGTHLARALKEYGMVEHTVWLEEPEAAEGGTR